MSEYGLSKSHDKQLQKIEVRIKSVATQAVFEIGRELLKAKAILSHGAFASWVQDAVGMKPRQAQRYMAATKRFSNAHLGAHLPASILMDLAPRSVPDEAVQQVANLVSDGQHVSREQTKEIIKQFREIDTTKADPAVIDAVAVEPSNCPEKGSGSDSRESEKPDSSKTPRQDAIWIWGKYRNRKDDLTALLRLLSQGANAIELQPHDWVYELRNSKQDYDPTSLVPPGKLNCPEFRDMWAQWCKYNELMGSPLFEPVAVAQMNQLKGRPVDKACKCLEKAMADRLLAIPAMKELPKKFKPPTVEEVAAFIKERHVEHVDPVEFVNHYQKQGWKIKSGTPVTDWKAAVFQWQARAKKDRGKKSFEEIYGKDLTTKRRTVDPSEAYRTNSSERR